MWFTRQKNHLYLFHHVAKCAGTTINRAILDAGTPSIFVNEKRLREKAQVRQQVEQALAARPALADSLEVIHGHRVFHGLHHYSRREPRYFTFLRDPVPRCVSNYNYVARNAFDPHTRNHERDRTLLLRDGELMSFREWVSKHYVDNHMTRYLAAAMEGEEAPPFLDGPVTDSHLGAAKEFLRLCFFVGFTEQTERDVPSIFKQMRVRAPVERVNVSGTWFSLEQDSSVVRDILDRNGYDMEVYHFARTLRGSGSLA